MVVDFGRGGGDDGFSILGYSLGLGVEDDGDEDFFSVLFCFLLLFLFFVFFI